MPSFGKWLRGNLYLGYRGLVVLPLEKLFRSDELTGKKRFLSNYATEGNVPTTLAEREILKGASRCIHCGLCDAYDVAFAAIGREVADGPSLLPVLYSRSAPDLPHAREALSRVSPEQLARGEAVCPTRVPLTAIAAFLEKKLAEVESFTRERAKKEA